MFQKDNIEQLWNHNAPINDESIEAMHSPLGLNVIENPLLRNIPPEIIKQAWFIMAHLVLEKDATILHMVTHNGATTYAMAALNPDFEFIGIISSAEQTEIAKDKYKLPNLKFIKSDIQENFMPLGSFDAIINSFNLHEIYSGHNCNEKSVTDILERQFHLLKKDGYIFTQGYNSRSEDDFILMEMPDDPSKNQTLEGISEIELLTLYSDSARPRENDNYRGFYLEELPPRFPKTKLFRLPAKWAYEFMLRKDNREDWISELHKEYSFFDRSDLKRIIRGLGGRLLYSAPHWNEEHIKNNWNKKIRLFKEDGEPIGTPETSFVSVIQKAPEQNSLTLEERRPSRSENPALRITAMRNEFDGSITDIVSRDMHISEILPYRVTEENKLHIYVHEGIPRCLANTIPRKGPNIDGKQWSGHMTEAFAIPEDVIEAVDLEHVRSTLGFAKEYLGLVPKVGELLQNGPGFFPAPDSIDEHIQTYYLCVRPEQKLISPSTTLDDISGFSTTGRIREIDAQQVLNAVGVGLIPTSRLEIQILALYEKLSLNYQSWHNCPLALQTENVAKPTKLQDIIANLARDDMRFKETKGTNGQFKTIQSVFVDEGQNDGGVKGLASVEKDFIINEENSMNTAVILPLVRSLNGEVMAGIVEQYLPVPQRYKGNGYSVNCPSIPLPVDIKNFDMAKRYIADKFEVPVECVARMGESYFSHIGITPQRVFPFAVSKAGASGWKKVGRAHGTTSYTPLYRLYRLLYLDNYYSFIKVVAMTYQAAIGYDSDLSASVEFSDKHEARKGSFVGMNSLNLSSGSSDNHDKKYNHDG